MTTYRVLRASDDVIAALGQTVTYDPVSNTWVPTEPASGGASSLAGLSDVDITGASEGDVLTREGGVWVAAAPTGGGGALVVVTGSTTIPSGSTEGELVGYRNSSGSPVDVSGTELASGEWGVWAWLGGAWVLLSTGVATGGITDTTPPTGGTLAVSGSGASGSTRTLTVTGASDETALHATPYRFSLDSGATWSGWQSSASWTSGPLDAGTYQPRATVRDAAGNTAVVSAATFGVDVTPDTTAPTPGTLASSAVTDTSFTLTVTGASDAGSGLHATPYAFSTDNGTTWTAWQAAASYDATGRTASTAYQCVHKVRVADLNEAAGTAITVTTTATPPPTLPITDAFTELDGTGVNGRAAGGLVWSSDISAINAFAGGSGVATIQGGRATNGDGSVTVGAMMDVGVGTVRVSAKLTSSAGSGGGPKIGFGKVIASTSAIDGVYLFYNRGQGVKVYAGDGDGGAPEQLGSTYTGAGTGAQTDLPCSIAWDGTTITATVNGTTILTAPYTLTGGTKAGFHATAHPGLAWDDFTVEDVSP